MIKKVLIIKSFNKVIRTPSDLEEIKLEELEGIEIPQLSNGDVLFIKIQKDKIGRSGSNPTWGHIFEVINEHSPSFKTVSEDGVIEEKDEVTKSGVVLKYKGIGLYKEYDYDYPNSAYSEKTYSIIGKYALPGVRVPDIDVVENEYGEHGIISYRILDNNNEDLIHISETLFSILERSEMKKMGDCYTIDEILRGVKNSILEGEESEKEKKEQNYKEVERCIIFTLLLDSITNNGDRHPNNWALIRIKETGTCELGVYDHSSTFVDMFTREQMKVLDGWSSSYIVKDHSPKTMKFENGLNGKSIIDMIYANDDLKEYCIEFIDNFLKHKELIFDQIRKEGLPVDFDRLIRRLKDNFRYLEGKNKVKEIE